MKYSFPDSASICKHIAAVLHGIGASSSRGKADTSEAVFDDLSSLPGIVMDEKNSGIVKKPVKKAPKKAPLNQPLRLCRKKPPQKSH